MMDQPDHAQIALPLDAREETAPQPGVVIEARFQPSISAVLWQNSVPVLCDLTLRNTTDENFPALRLELSCDLPAVHPRTWMVQQFAPGQIRTVQDLDVQLGGPYLSALTEACRCTVTLTATNGETVLAVQTIELRLLPANQWGGVAGIPDLLAAFVLPNDPAVASVLLKASELMRAQGIDDSLEGYQRANKQRVWQQAAAVWSAVCHFDLHYINPPASFEQAGQRVRLPSQIIEERLATCLDTATFFAACLEQIGLRPLLVITRGHAHAGVWLTQDDFGNSVIADAAGLRNRLKLDDLLLFETTLCTQAQKPGFTAAQALGAAHVAAEKEQDFECVIDISRARQRGIKPLATVSAPIAAVVDDVALPPPMAPPIEAAPIMRPGLDDGRAPISSPTISRLERWRQRLLDLSGRNRLLNLPVTTKQVLPIVAADIGRVEDMLSGIRGSERAAPLRFVPSPGLMRGADPRRADFHRDRTAEDAEHVFAREALARNELVADRDEAAMQSALLEIFRAARNAQQEGGTNTLFLTLGSLMWKRQDRDRPYRAPLLLMPVTLERQSVRSGFTLRPHDDEVRINDTLLEMLRQDFDLHLHQLTGALPTDGAGLDVRSILDIVRAKLRHIPGWEVAEDITLTNLSFTKYLMWKDLADRLDALQQNAVVRRLVAAPDDAELNADHSISSIEDAQAESSPQGDLVCPLEADSSQAHAVAFAASGRSFVMIGPPGTGKSQTIANIIANTLAQGRTVLFVAEKRAALEVVQRRLHAVGLADFCLDLFSSKASKHAVLQQLDRARNVLENFEEAEWVNSGATIESLTSELNGYVQALHKRGRNGLTAFKAMSTVLLAEDQELPRLGLQWSRADLHDVGDYQRMLEFVSEAQATWQRTGDAICAARLSGVQLREWSPPAEHRLLEAARATAARLQGLGDAARTACEALGLDPHAQTSAQALAALEILSRLLLQAPGMDAGWALDSGVEAAMDHVREAAKLAVRHAELHQALAHDWKPGIFALPLREIRAQWQAAQAKWALPRSLALSKLRKILAAEANGALSGECLEDLDRLVEIHAITAAIQAMPVAGLIGHRWKGVQTNFAELEAGYAWSRHLRSAQAACATYPLSLAALRERVRLLIVEASDLLEPQAASGRALHGFLDARSQAMAALESLVPLCGAIPAELIPQSEPDWASRLAAVLAGWTDSIRGLKDWCGWQRIKHAGMALGLEKLPMALEQGLFNPVDAIRVFEADYARWWIGLTVEETAVLRNFAAATHEKRIERFREMDQAMLGLASRLVRLRLSRNTQRDGAQRGDKEHLLLNHELQKRMRHLPVRQLMDRMPRLMRQLTPCLMMSPLSVAQFLPADAASVDLVIFDEASQIATWDAIGAIGRGSQVVVVGDPKQLPPTDFFQRQLSDGQDSEIATDQQDLESVLDECLGRGLPTVQLNWHYRSRHESLIAFSNHAYYGGRLVTFPSPATEDRAVSLRHVANGVYAKGGARTNLVEAQEIVAETVRQLERSLAGTSKRSIGIVTFNAAQQDLIENLLEDARRKNPALEPFFAEDASEPVMIKSLESVQGEERDVMLFSLTYGPDDAGKIAMNFGPLNNTGGERRLNVAVTRAREELIVFSSLRPDQIDLARTNAQGVRHLKQFLAYAEHGARAMIAVDEGSVGDFDSGFEEAVAIRLRRLGWEVRPQIGVSGFRIDLGVVDPDAQGRFLAGVECDGATYHRSATARDRDRLRQNVLEGLGWTILRIWSTDWWTNPERETERLHATLNACLEMNRRSRPDSAATRT
jgi:very-short-patch-repair endonuclease